MAVDFSKIKDEIISAGVDVSNKAKEATNLAKIKLDIRAKQEALSKLYEELGKTYYEEHVDDEALTEDERFKAIREARAELVEVKDQLLDKKGSVICDNCGEKQPADVNYCSNCGASLKKGE